MEPDQVQREKDVVRHAVAAYKKAVEARMALLESQADRLREENRALGAQNAQLIAELAAAHAGEKKSAPGPLPIPQGVLLLKDPNPKFARKDCAGNIPLYGSCYRDRGPCDRSFMTYLLFDRYDCLSEYEEGPAPPIGDRKPLSDEYFRLVLAMAGVYADVRPIYRLFHER